MDLFDNHFFPELGFQYNDKKVLNQMSDIMLKTTKTLECVIDYNWINILVENSLFFNILTDYKIKQKNIAVRFVTTITPENISNCTKLKKFVELRHTDNIIGYVGILIEINSLTIYDLFIDKKITIIIVKKKTKKTSNY